MVKTWYKVIYEGGWFKEDTLEAAIATATKNELYKGRVKRVVKITERDCSLKELKEGR